MNAPAEIVEVTEANVGLLSTIDENVFDEPIDPARLNRCLAEPGHIMLLAILDAEVIGMCTAMIHRHADRATELYLDEIGVATKAQRRGIARQLLTRMFKIGRERGCAAVWLGTELDNVAARALYDSLGPSESRPFVYYLFDLDEA